MRAPALALLALPLLSASVPDDEELWVVYEPPAGKANGKHVVLVSGDEEYRSEEALPMLGKILSQRHGFRCTVLFATNPETGEIEPNEQTNIPGMHLLETADVMVNFLRFRELPDADMKYFADYVEAGKPLLGIRTSTHAFDIKRNKESAYARYHWRRGGDDWKNGFGGEILGETWVSHHGRHGSQSTRGVVEAENRDHPVLRGVTDVWGPTDVYGIRELPPHTTVLLRGAVCEGMTPESPPVEGKQNDPMMPIVWVRELPRAGAAAQRVMCSTIGAATDCESEGLRRALVNGVFWLAGMDVPEEADVAYVGEFDPTPFGFNRAKKGVRATDHRLP